MSVKVVDKGLDKLVKAFASSPKFSLTVGVHEADGAEAHTNGRGLSVADVATIHEFGAPGIPQRSFLRAWFDENENQIRVAIKRMAASVSSGKRTREEAINLLGQTFVGQIQKRIARGIPPPNAPSTIARKGSSVPLIDTGQLRTSISYAIDGELQKM